MGRQGPEAVKEALAATIAAHLPAFLDAEWAEWGDGATVPEVYPRAVLPGHRTLVREHPTVMVDVPEGQMTENGAPYWGAFAHQAEVTALLRGDDEVVLEHQADRYLWALWKLLMQYQQLDGTLVGSCSVTPTRYGKSPAYPEKPSSPLLLKAVGWEVTVELA